MAGNKDGEIKEFSLMGQIASRFVLENREALWLLLHCVHLVLYSNSIY
jgi:hypothetical protein